MNVVDCSGWLAYFAGDANATFFAPVIKQTNALIVPTVCLYEVFKRLLTVRGEENALQATGIMSSGLIVDLTPEIAVNAAYLSNKYKFAMADSIILATTQAHKATLWTQDSDFCGMDCVRYIEKK